MDGESRGSQLRRDPVALQGEIRRQSANLNRQLHHHPAGEQRGQGVRWLGEESWDFLVVLRQPDDGGKVKKSGSAVVVVYSSWNRNGRART